MLKKIFIVLMLIFNLSNLFADDTGINLLPYNNPNDWLDNQRKPVSGEKIFANLKSLANHIYSDSSLLHNKIDGINDIFSADSTIKDNRIAGLENFNLTLEDTFLSKNNNIPYTPINDYNPATKKFVLDNVFGGSGVETTAVLIIVEPDSISKNFRLTLLEADSAVKNLLINNIENDSILKNIRINALEYFKSTINDTFYTETEINSFLNSIGVDTTLLKNNIIILQTQINNISGDSITTGIISYLRIDDKFLRNDTEDTGDKLNLKTLNISKTFTVDGNITLGKIDGFGNKPDLTLNANLKTDLIPSGNSYKLGSAAQRWRYIYADTMIVTTLGADSVEISGTLLNNFTVNSGNNTFENSSLTFYQADSTIPHGSILYRYNTNDFLLNKKVSINGDVLSSGTFSGKADSLTINSISVKNYIDSASAFLETNKADSVHTHLISNITDSVPYSRISEKPFIPDTAPYALQSAVDAIITDTAEWSKIQNKPAIKLNNPIYFEEYYPVFKYDAPANFGDSNVFINYNNCSYTIISFSDTSYFNVCLDLTNYSYIPADTPSYLIFQIMVKYPALMLDSQLLTNYALISIAKSDRIQPVIMHHPFKVWSGGDANFSLYNHTIPLNINKKIYFNAQFNNDVNWVESEIFLILMGYGY